jgi:glycosyltransferase involved in cell wall biosynthesis
MVGYNRYSVSLARELARQLPTKLCWVPLPPGVHPDIAAQLPGTICPPEGFGLQVCEAMAVGCPVLVARATSLPEIMGNGGETFALDHPSELTALLTRVAEDGVFREELRRRARSRSQDFSWNKTAQETVAVYRRLLGIYGQGFDS